ncbi:MAG: hydrogenase expression/formation protein HypE [Bacteroidales bacterium]|nr:hydrogenase expression/formation protein HypE [Bacteroidales bacterium]
MDNIIMMGHGSGGRMTSDLIRNTFAKYFSNPVLDIFGDAAVFTCPGSHLTFTTDSYVIDPIFFPGGDVGKLAVYGTINDLAVTGSTPLFLSAAFILEEGLPIDQLDQIACSMGEAANNSGVSIVAGDTKVVKKGQCDKIFITTSGIGLVQEKHKDISSGSRIRPGDKIIVSGFLGDHEICILSARENLQFENPLPSDVAPLSPMIQAVMDSGASVKFMRDITRGGLATVCAEITEKKSFGITIEELQIPVREQVAGLCELYGFDPLYLANEGKILAVTDEPSAQKILEIMHKTETGTHAAIIGEVTDNHPGRVIMKSVTGGNRIIDRLSGLQLPRIC